MPGWVVVRRVVPDLPVPGAIGAAIVTSVYVSAHLVNVVARVTGFGRAAVIVSAVILALASVVVAQIRHRWLTPLPRPTRAGIVGRAPGGRRRPGSWPPPTASRCSSS